MSKVTPDGERGARSLLRDETPEHPAPFSRVMPLRLRSAPLLLLAVCFAAGVLCRPWWQPAHDMVAVCTLLLLTAWAAWLWAPRLAWSTIAFCWIALGWTASSFERTAGDGSLLPYADELQRTLDARIVAVKQLPPHAPPMEEAAAWRDVHGDEENAFAALDHASGPTYSMDLQANAIEYLTPDLSRMVPMTGGAQVTLYSRSGVSFAPPPCGAHVLMTVRLHPPHRYNDPGVWQYAETLAQRGISVESSVDGASLRVLDTAGAPWLCRFSAAQHWSTQRLALLARSPLLARLPPAVRFTSDDAAILSAMLFGDRTQLDHGLRQSFERTGSFHLFVVAGAHIAIVLAVLYGGLLRLRVPRWIAAMAALSAAAAYAIMTGFGAPVQRALLMAAVYLLTECLSRERNALNAIGAAALTMLLVHPHALLESSFQMTLLAALAIAGVAVPLGERTLMPYAGALRDIEAVRNDPKFSPHLAQFRVSMRWLGDPLGRKRRNVSSTRWQAVQRSLPASLMRVALLACELVLITFVAEVAMALPMAVYFHRVTPFAGPANLLALPMLAVLMACAVSTFLLSLVHPVLAAVPAMFTALLLHGVTRIIGTLGSLHGGDVRTPAPLPGLIAAALLLWTSVLFLLRWPARRVGLAGCALILLVLLVVLWPGHPQLHPDRLEFTAIDVGQGDSLLVGSPRGRAMLIDAGGPTGSAALTDQSSFDTGEEVVSPYLWSRGIRRLDIVVLTHAHSDHIGGMASVLRNFRPRELWVSVDADTSPYLALLRIARQSGTAVRHLHTGDRLPWDGTSVQVLSPALQYEPHSLPTNDDSLVLRISYGRASVLAEGDAEHASEQAVADSHPEPVTLLKIGHHGSNTSTAPRLLELLHPCSAVISCGLGNRFGHPRLQVLQRLQAAGVRTSRTDEMGAVQYLMRPDGSIETHVIASNP